MVTPGTYELFMDIPDARTENGEQLSASYDGVQWNCTDGTGPLQVSLEAGDAIVLSGDGLQELNEKAINGLSGPGAAPQAPDMTNLLPAAPALPQPAV